MRCRCSGLGTRHRRDLRHPHRPPPAWPWRTGSELDQVWPAQRLSTVYMPGWKLTMLPDALVEAYTLAEGRDCPALSLYLTLRRGDARSESGHETKHRVACRSPPTCATTSSMPWSPTPRSTGDAAAEFPFADELRLRLAAWRKALQGCGAKAARGKPENLQPPGLQPSSSMAIDGREPQRRRDACRSRRANAARRSIWWWPRP